MKKYLLIVALTLMAIGASAQSLNILNYSGKMYISKMQVLTTPRYVSYEDHAILSTEMTVPVMEVTKVIFDFEKNIVNMNDKDQKVLSKSIKKYTKDYGYEVVIYLQLEDNDRHELIWPEYGEPYLQAISKNTDGSVSICRMYLATKPTATSPEDAIRQLFGGY